MPLINACHEAVRVVMGRRNPPFKAIPARSLEHSDAKTRDSAHLLSQSYPQCDSYSRIDEEHQLFGELDKLALRPVESGAQQKMVVYRLNCWISSVRLLWHQVVDGRGEREKNAECVQFYLSIAFAPSLLILA
jgi:hypothetical protein